MVFRSSFVVCPSLAAQVGLRDRLVASFIGNVAGPGAVRERLIPDDVFLLRAGKRFGHARVPPRDSGCAHIKACTVRGVLGTACCRKHVNRPC